METIENKNAKQPYYFKVYNADEVNAVALTQLLLTQYNTLDKNHRHKSHGGGLSRRLKTYRVGNGKYTKAMYDIEMSFDIETTSVNCDEPFATMYIWQMGINQNVVIGRTWSQFINILDLIKTVINPSKNQRLFCAVHNLGFEFQFMRKWLNVTDAFLKEQRTPLYIEHDGFIQFRDTLAMTQQSLKKLAETYTNTQKCAGDLDYSKPRHFRSYLDPIELNYCYNDVLILCEYMRYYNDTFLSKGFAPLTSTGVLNKEVQDGFKNMSENYKHYIKNSHPIDYDFYTWVMSCVYRGGYVHANELYINEIFTPEKSKDMVGVDFTSSYPAVMLYCRYGYKFRTARATALCDIMRYIKNDYSVLCELSFYGIERTTAHTIESISKCIEYDGVVRDNGRVARAKYLRVALTCQDVLNYCDFYKWRRCVVHKCYIAQREYLPKYLIQPLLDAYTLKNQLKRDGLDDSIEYKLAKARVNSFYGLTVKKLPIARVCYSNDGWSIEDGKPYEKNKENGLLPYFGVFVSAFARRNLLSNVAKLERAGVRCIYEDTDSIKILNYNNNARKILTEYNDHIKELTTNAKQRYNIGDLIDGLGEFDFEYGDGTKHGRVEYFKTLGAKRYIITTVNGHKNQTIAGLPKNILFKQYATTREVMDAFNDDLIVNDCKLMSSYNDNEVRTTLTDYNGKTVEIYEKSSVALLSTDFTLSIDDAWLLAYTEYQQQYLTLEQRNIKND